MEGAVPRRAAAAARGSPRACELHSLHSGSANEDRVRHGVGLFELTVKLLPVALRYVGTPLLKCTVLEIEVRLRAGPAARRPHAATSWGNKIFLFLVEIFLER